LGAKHANVITAARSVAELNAVADEINQLGGNALAVPTDITNPAQCKNLVDETVAKFGRLDILVLNAGTSMWSAFEDIEDTSFFSTIMETNYTGAVNCVHAALPELKNSQGLIAAVTTAQALMGFPYHSGYAASKHALQGFLDTLDIEMEGAVHFLNIYLGWIRDTNLRSKAYGAAGQILGQEQRQHNKESVSLDECTTAIIRAMEREKKKMYLPAKLKLVPFLKVFLPRYLRHKVFKAVRKQDQE